MRWNGIAALGCLSLVILFVVACGGGGGGGGSSNTGDGTPTTITISGTLGAGSGKPIVSEGGLPSYASSYENYTAEVIA